MRTARTRIASRGMGRLPDGYTLIEITLVIFIMALFIGIAAVSFAGLSGEQDLKKPASELEIMAREAVRRAGMYEQPQVIVFEKTGFAMRYQEDASALASNGADKNIWVRRTEVPANMKILLKHWGMKKWIPAAGERWIALPSGLCEPIQVRMELGRSYIEMEFNPLTGAIADENMEVR